MFSAGPYGLKDYLAGYLGFLNFFISLTKSSCQLSHQYHILVCVLKVRLFWYWDNLHLRVSIRRHSCRFCGDWDIIWPTHCRWSDTRTQCRPADHHGINNSEIISHNIVGSGCLLGRGVGSAINLLPGHWPGGWGWSAGWVAGNGNILFAAGFPNCTNCFVKVHYRALPGYSRPVTAPRHAQLRSCCTWNCEV